MACSVHGDEMFNHRKVLNSNANEVWTKLKKTVSKEVAYKATEVIGEYTAIDMLDFASLNKSNVDRIYVKYRDGLPMASGMKKILPKADIIYLNTERKGYHNDKVEISPLDTKREEEIEDNNNNNKIMWFADPINARGTTTLEVIRYLHEYIPFEVGLLSHVVANRIGIDTVQTQMSDFNIDAYMNYAFLSKKINQQNGYLEDALEIIPDLGDKVFGTIGADYPISQMQEDINCLLGTKVGDIEILKGIIIYLLQKRESDDYIADRKVKWATREWIKKAVEWYTKFREIEINIDIGQHFNLIFDDLEDRGFIKYLKYPYKDSFARHYYITEEGVDLSSKAYLPILFKLGIPDQISKDFDFIVHVSANDIHEQIHNHAS